MKRILSIICCMVLCSMPALARGKADGHQPMSDQEFVDFAAQTDMVEANLGQLARGVSSSQQVRDYAILLSSDHTNDYHQLYDVAHQANLTIPDAINAENDKKMIDPFQKLKGEAFDQRYIREMVAGHTEAIAIYKREAEEATNPAIKAYAQQTLPTLEKHLSGAKALKTAK